MTPALRADGLRILAPSGASIVEDVSLEVVPGEILGLVGESGSGKTTTALALLGFAAPGIAIAAGTVEVAGTTVALADERAARRLRGRVVSYVPQDPANALNPALRIGDALRDMVTEHGDTERASIGDALAAVDLPGDTGFLRRYPHQLSGGQQQRVAIAMALTCEPPLVVLDEPTTGLDVVTQARVLDELRRLREQRGLSMVYVSHDLAVVATLSDRVAVMYAGRIVEEGPTREVLARPRHPYTRGLVESIPDHVRPIELETMAGTTPAPDERPAGCVFAPRCPQRLDRCATEVPALGVVAGARRVACFAWEATPAVVRADRATRDAAAERETPLLRVERLAAEHRTRHGTVVAAHDVSFDIGHGGCAALVGESGSGKTTIARCVVGLHDAAGGVILLDGAALPARARDRTREQRRRIQIVFQNPYDSLNPRRRVGDEIARPARVLRGLSAAAARADVATLLERVRLPARVGDRFPGELSGGERQRVAIARALAAGPEVLVCDEVTSALDVSVQAAVLELLDDVRRELDLA
ncbi:MAG: ABC transporter ATP-binding protein, partial [Gaiella sp.]